MTLFKKHSGNWVTKVKPDPILIDPKIVTDGIGVNLLNTSPIIDKVVYTLWTDFNGCIKNGVGGWFSAKAHLMSLVISVMKSSQHFSEVELITDSQGWDVIKKLNLPFTDIKFILDEIPKEYSETWALAKLYSYSVQTEPFIHIDIDAIFLSGLPYQFRNKNIVAHHIEGSSWMETTYNSKINTLSKVLSYFPKGWREIDEVYALGVFGGTDVDTISKISKEAIDFVQHDDNKIGWKSLVNKRQYNVIIEQYTMSALMKSMQVTPYCLSGMLNKTKLEDMGYIHLWGAKKSQETELLLTDFMKKNYLGKLKTIESIL